MIVPGQPNGPTATNREPVPNPTPLSAYAAMVTRERLAQEHE